MSLPPSLPPLPPLPLSPPSPPSLPLSLSHIEQGSSEEGEQLTKQPQEKEGVVGGTPPRQFSCVAWELNPHLHLLSSVSGEFNPHISWLLERLGFKHARTTIPKWVQRGAMDPLDKMVSVVVELLVQFSAKKKLQLSASPSLHKH